ncbi:hypothetical protein KKE26_12655 [bacterium]|nr:hypothetical protein [bacterium]
MMNNATCYNNVTPSGFKGEEHSDGEIWSACLWKVRKLLGRKKADTVIMESHFYLSQYSVLRTE